MKIKVFIVLLFYISTSAFSQVTVSNNEVLNEQNKEDFYLNIENLIIDSKIDSALFFIEKQKQLETSNYLTILERISTKSASYNDYYKVASNINNRSSNELNYLTNFIENIPAPINQQHIALDYVYSYWLLITKLRNASKIEQATELNEQINNYVQKFDQTDTNVKKANLLLNTHQIVLFLIENNIEEGKTLTLHSLHEAKSLNDNILQIIFLNHLCDFLILERDLDGFISNSELSLSLESNSKEKSPYYIQTLEKLIDAYLFKGGNNQRVHELLDIVYSSPSSQKFSYSLYANFLRVLDEKSPLTTQIFQKFEVDNYIDFCATIEEKGRNTLDQNQFYFVLSQSSQLLESKNYLKEAIAYKTKCVILTRKIYSEDLASSLANYRTEQAVKGKELELTHQKDKTNLYAIITGLIGLVLLILIYVLYKKNKQEKLLKIKNIEIAQQRDAIIKKDTEKGLLLKEVHHRVKNNFQIVSSLLELQTKGIEDKKALALANEGKNRINSMAIIHQKLYQNDNNLIDFDAYIRQLVQELKTMYASSKEIETNIKSEPTLFDVDTAIPLGLIINELITNAYKYAFSTEHESRLEITLNKEDDDYFKLIVSDNGPGLNNAIDLKKVKSLGLRLVSRLVKQLQGTLKHSNAEGAYFEIYFKDTHLRKMVD